MSEIQKYDPNKKFLIQDGGRRTTGRRALTAVTAAGALFAGGVVVGNHNGNPQPSKPGIEAGHNVKPQALHIVEKKPTNEALDEATMAGIQAAYGVVGILASEASTTTEGYRGNMVGNKDPELPTDVPEAFMYYDQEANTLGLSAVQMYDGKTGKVTNEYIKSGAHKSKFSSMMVTFDIAPGNPITKVNRQLQIGDFREALADNTLTLKAANGSWFDKDNVDVPGSRDYDVSVNGGNVTTKLDEDGDGMSIDDVDARVNNKPQMSRIRQVLGATIEDFKADLK